MNLVHHLKLVIRILNHILISMCFSLQCLDFAATAHLFHLLFCSVYGGFPGSWSWWLINLACMALMVVIGEFFCMRTELRAIPVSVMSVKSSV